MMGSYRLTTFGLYLVSSALFCVGSAHAWISSGGELFRDSQNPWFIQNTLEVKYCVEVDTKSISISQSQIWNAISRSIQYWKSNFEANADIAKSNIPFAVVGSQTFVQLSKCDGKEDLRFQFGFGTLDKKQKDYLGDPTRFAAITVRTDYDEVNLKAKGFVFVSSDLGSNRFKNSIVPTVQEAWSKPGLLCRVLTHELGHVFGVPHIGGGSIESKVGFLGTSEAKLSLMDERYPEKILSEAEYKKYLGTKDLEPYFTFVITVDAKVVTAEAREFLELHPDESGVMAKVDQDGSNIQLFATKVKGVDTVLSRTLGNVTLISGAGGFDHGMMTFKSVVQLRMTPRQRVFSEEIFRESNGILMGPCFLDFEMQGSYVGPSQKPKKVLARVGSQKIEIIAASRDWILPLW